MEKIIDNYINIFEYTTEINLDVDKVNDVRIRIEKIIKNINKKVISNKLFKLYHLLSLTMYRTNRMKESIQYEFKALEYANKINNKYYIARAYGLISVNNIMVENMEEANKYYLLAEKYYEELSKYENLAHLNSKFAVYIFRINKDEIELREYLEKALISINKVESPLPSQIYITIASIYSIVYGDFEVAIDLYLRALDVAKYYNDIAMEALIIYYIGFGYGQIKGANEAIEQFNKVLEDSRFAELTSIRLSVMYDLIALFFEEDINIDKVPDLLNQCDEEIKKLDHLKGKQYKMQLDLLTVEYNIKIDKENIKENLYILDRSKKFYYEIKGACIFTYIDYHIDKLCGDIYYKLGEVLKSAQYHKSAVDISKKYKAIKCVIKAYEALIQDYKALEDYENACDTLEELNTIIMEVERSKLMKKYKDVQKSYKRLKWVEKEREEFFANLSHELKTPINIIYSSTQLMNLFKSSSEESFREYYLKHENSVKINCLRMLKIVQNMIDMNKIDCGVIKPNFVNYNIVTLIEAITMSVLSYVEIKNINITFDTEEEDIIVKCDPYMIERILLNLLSNAIKFSKEQGNIYVKIYIEGDFVIIKVADNGIGIPNNMKDSIFSKFVQIDRTFKRKNEGSGIGLSLVKSLVDIHKGYIELDSIEGLGSEFRVFIPNEKLCEEVSGGLESYDIDIDRVYSELSDIYEL